MKVLNLLPAAIAVSMIASCSNREHNPEFFSPVPVTIHVDGFTVSQSDLPATKATPVANFNNVNAITLAFYQGTTEIYKTTQLKDDATTYTTFGDFSTSLPMGSYKLVAIAYMARDASPFTLTSPTEAAYTGERAYETFLCSDDLSINNTTAIEMDITLDRIVSQLQVLSTDGKAENVSNIRMTFSAGGKSFNPSTGLAISNTGFSNTVSVSAAVGSTSNSLSCLFLATDEQNINVTIETLDSDGNTLFSKTVQNVPFKRNRKTTLTGAMYSADASGSFQLNTSWLTSGDDITF